LENHVVSCVQDSDCAVVEIGCCGAWCLQDGNIGGSWAVAVNWAYEEIVKERNSETCDPDQVCPDIACPPIFPLCNDGECELREEDYRTCAVDEDCVIVELGCCDHCNGGRVDAVHRDRAEEIQMSFGDDCEEDEACTEMACAPMLARCTDWTCESYPDPAWAASPE